MWEYYLAFWRQWRCFHGRARRPAFWYVLLIQALLLFGLMVVFQLLPLPQFFVYLATAYYVLSLVPMLSLQVRRLHDTGWSAWWLLLHFLGPVGAVTLLVLFGMEGDPADNRYGPAPKSM